jgi:hypothetical protein
MKKLLTIVAVITILTSCGGASTTPKTTDSTSVKADTTAQTVDTTKAAK